MPRVFILLLLLTYVATGYSQTFVLNSPLLKSHQTTKVKNGLALLVEAFNAIGIDVVFRYRPDKRSITEADAGLVDGDFVRIASIVNRYPNVVVVPEALSAMDIVAFSINPSIDLSEYKIEEHQYHIGYLAGWKHVSDMLENYAEQTAVGEYDTLFRLLIGERVDLVFFNKTAGELILQQQNVHRYQVSPSLLSYTTYLVLHKKHADLVEPLTKEIKRLKAKSKREQNNWSANKPSI